MDLFVELVGEIIYYLFGALVGVLYPAKSRMWARWQLCGLGMGLIALLTFCVAGIVSRLSGPAALIGFASLTGYAIVGNVCRNFHEGKHASSASPSKKNIQETGRDAE